MCMKQKLGTVTAGERDAIQGLFERKNALQELFGSLNGNAMSEGEFASLYEKIVKDMGKTTTAYKQWWSSMSETYGWEEVHGKHWTINFSTCEVFLADGNAVE